MSRNGEGSGRRSIAVVGTHSPARNLAMASLLTDCIEKHGWSERLSVSAAGLGAGAGAAAAGELAQLDGLPAALDGSACPDIESEPTVLDAAQCLVVGSEAEAELLCQWPGAEGKPVVAFCEFADIDDSAIDNPHAELTRFCDEVADVVPSVLRSLVARY